MRRGLFGKVLTKRDFVAPGLPRAFLSVWEPWLQGAVAASRVELGPAWNDSFLTAPIWRFWLGADLCGASALGAVMPSMDGVGRLFPLSLAFVADEGEAIPPPEIDAQEEWFEAVETLLFGALEPDRPYESLTAWLDALPQPNAGPARDARIVNLVNQEIVVDLGELSFAEGFRAARLANPARACAGASFWWTAGGEGFGRLALAAARLPNPAAFSCMLTGRLPVDDLATRER